MVNHPDLLAEITETLNWLGLRASDVQVACLAMLYRDKRPRNCAAEVAALMVNLPGLKWPSGLDDRTPNRNILMAALVEQLDMGYWCDTVEHDGEQSRH